MADVCFALKLNRFASVCLEVVLDGANGAEVQLIARGRDGAHENSIESCSFTRMPGAAEPFLATGDWDGALSLWSVRPASTGENGSEAAISKKRRRDKGGSSIDEVELLEPLRSWKAHAQCARRVWGTKESTEGRGREARGREDEGTGGLLGSERVMGSLRRYRHRCGGLKWTLRDE
eukprot:scaffold7092_cov262-Pinguiococcus_pyrenoidosus.AAC.55